MAQLAAVLAHEFGHYYGGDTALGPWVYKTRAAIGRTLRNLSGHSALLMKPFEWYGNLFLQITHAISRAQEYSADALAARIVGGKPLVEGLKAVQNVVASELGAPRPNPYDTHPPLRDRIAALEGDRVVKGWENDALAVTLNVWVPAWTRVAQQHARRLKGTKPTILAELAPNPASLAVALAFSASPEVTTQDHAREAVGAFGAALTLALVSAGWELSAEPGEPVRLRHRSHEIRPFEAWSQILEREISPEGWRSLCDQTGISDLDLGTAAPPKPL